MTHTFKTALFSAVTAAMLLTLPAAVQAGSVSTDGSFEIATTNGMDRRGDRRDDRQDCRVSEGAAGADKRDCKQDSRNG
ncbi:MAG: hypothetical protein ACU0A6_12010 [Shimia sp.]|jgi:hypothetical protein|uniref:hypothetical protein n=1 Tax=Shimia sp. TaxID=1954381 RepID=UPI0040594027